MSLQKRAMVALGILAVFTLVLSACTVVDESTQAAGPAVHMGSTNFLASSITLKKGQFLTLTNNASDEHIITNGSWDGTAQKPHKEPGAPAVNMTFQGQQSQRIGPFSTAGTFHLYCTIHQGMNLAVTVQ